MKTTQRSPVLYTAPVSRAWQALEKTKQEVNRNICREIKTCPVTWPAPSRKAKGRSPYRANHSMDANWRKQSAHTKQVPSIVRVGLGHGDSCHELYVSVGAGDQQRGAFVPQHGDAAPHEKLAAALACRSIAAKLNLESCRQY